MKKHINKLKFNYKKIFLISTIYLISVVIGWNVYKYISIQQNKSIPSSNTTNPVFSNNTEKAIKLLQNIPEIQIIEKSVVRAGRKPFYTPEGENGDIVTISLRESFPDDPHTSRIDTFNINIKTNFITVEDVVSGQDISFSQWKKEIKNRFR
jgi:hypothetical protein